MLIRVFFIIYISMFYIACDTNVRDVFGSRAIYSTDGERIATIRYRYEHFNNLITTGTGPGSRKHKFSLYTWDTPEVGINGVTSLQSFPNGQADHYMYEGQLIHASYIHNDNRSYIVGMYRNEDRESKAALLRLNADGVPNGEWRFFGEEKLEIIRPNDDGSIIVVVTRRIIDDQTSNLVATFYHGDTLAILYTHVFNGNLNPSNYGSTLFNAQWHKTPAGLSINEISDDYMITSSLSNNQPHPVSPAWPIWHEDLMTHIDQQRTLDHFEWSFVGWIDAWANPINTPTQLYTFRQDNSIEHNAIHAHQSWGLNRLFSQDFVYKAKLDGTGYQAYAVSQNEAESVTIYSPLNIAVAIDNDLEWNDQVLSFKYQVTFGAGYPYQATFEIDSIDRIAHSIRGHIKPSESYRADSRIYPLNDSEFAAIRLDWTRDENDFLYTCFINAAHIQQLNHASIDHQNLSTGCDGNAWSNLSQKIGQDCEGTWGGYNYQSCDIDCAGVWGGNAQQDGCGVCDTDRSNDHITCDQDCAGVYDGNARWQAGECVIPNQMALIPAGEFISGKPERERLVTLPAFYMDLYEVTAGEYHSCVVAGACSYSGPRGREADELGEWVENRRTYQNNRDQHPINYVTWSDASDYCAWVGKRLPSMLEWEKAARGTDGRTYPWGEEEASCEYAIMWSPDDGNESGCGTGHTQAVGQLPAGRSPYGIYDMAGNISEWTLSSLIHRHELQQTAMGGDFETSGSNALSPPNHYGTYPYELDGRYGFRCAQ